MEIVRSNREALDLIHLFLRESDDNALVKDWVGGEIIENATARQAVEDDIKETAEKAGMPFSISGMKSGMYSVLSKFTHVSYTALLEAYDVYRHDFDFERIGGYHYVQTSSLPYVRTEIHSTIIMLKAFYSVVQDRDSYIRLDELLRKHAPHMYDEAQRKIRHADLLRRLTQE